MNYIALIFALSVSFFAISYGEEIKDETPVNPQQLYDTIGAADRLVVKDSPIRDAHVLFESTDRKDLDALQRSLVIEKPKEWFHCMCVGTPAIYFYKGGSELGLLTNHHGISIRFSLWSSDAPVIDTERWLTWFDERKITAPRKEVKEMRIREEKSQKDWERWLAAMPEPVKPLWADALGQFGNVDVAPLSQALKAATQDESQRILILLEWFGSGAGPWSGYPAYESAAEEMLLEYETEHIVSAINSTQLTQAQIEGAARLFGGWSFSRKRPGELRKVSDILKETLWNHIKSTQDRDKLGRAKRAFNN